jgi:FkbM family methyltransferase
MKKSLKPFLRGFLSKFKPFREIGYFLYKKEISPFLVVSRRDCHCYMLVDTRDEYAEGVIRRGKIESPEDEFIKKIVKPSQVAVDVGAHWGGFSLLLGKLVGKGGKVFSFEPFPKSFKLLKRNLKINHLTDRVKVYPFAVGDKNEEVKLKVASTSSGHNSILRKNLPAREVLRVKQVRLDDALKTSKVDFLKIDVEGYEYFVLKGAENLIKNNRLWLFLEYSPAFMGEELTEKLTEFLKRYFEKPFAAYRKKIFQTSWDEVEKIAADRGQLNLFLLRKEKV